MERRREGGNSRRLLRLLTQRCAFNTMRPFGENERYHRVRPGGEICESRFRSARRNNGMWRRICHDTSS